jgi:hypothetical protein
MLTLGTLMVGVAIALARAGAQTAIDPMAATIAPTLGMIEKSFVGLADAMPAEKYGFRPTGGEFTGVRTFAEQVKHVACANFAFYNEMEHKTPPERCEEGGPNPAKTKAELMAYLRDSFAYAGRVLKTLTPANAMEPTRSRECGATRGQAPPRRCSIDMRNHGGPEGLHYFCRS